MSQNCTIFTGCSFTAGYGLPNGINDENLWVKILHQSCPTLSNTKLVNLSVPGNNNIEILQSSIDSISQYNCKYLFVAWTELLRYKFSVGIETYPVNLFFSHNAPVYDISVNPGITYTKGYIKRIKDRFLDLHHDHYEILKILQYTSTIKQLCQKLKINVYFVNAILPWDIGFFNYITKSTRVPSDVTEYTQHLLNGNTRDDDEFFKLYDSIHQEYKNCRVNSLDWINLDTGFRKYYHLDYGHDKIHPGIVSHQKFGKHLVESFKKIQLTKDHDN